jgi:hypothetical protein
MWQEKEILENEAARLEEVAQAARVVGDRITEIMANLIAESYRRLAREI